ncbi:MAG: hypothetical protein PUD59_02105 [bacterium]|nr:hypothetical protein [bacterium]
MILKKPYAFLIKHFRLIHGILSILLMIITYNIRIISNFLSNYIAKSNYLKIRIEPSISSIPSFLYLLIVLAVLICFIIYFLMRHKSKPTKLYTSTIIFYILLSVGLIFTDFQMASLTQNNATLRYIMASRDIMNFFYYSQYLLIIISLVRTFGFDIKRFNFNRDLKELEIMSNDNEEFELDIEIDSNDVKAKNNRRGRFFKYYIAENKKLLLLFIISILFILSGIFLSNKYLFNKEYNENQTFSFNNLSLKVKNSYETIYDNKNNDMSEEKYIYYIIKLNIKNNSDNIHIIDIGLIRLNVGNNYYKPDTSLYKYFSDIGEGYSNQIIKKGSDNNYIIAFKVDKEYSNLSKTLELVKNKNTRELSYTVINLKPNNLDEEKLISEVSLNEVLNIKNNTLGDIELNIEEYNISSKFNYKYEEEINNKKYTFTGIVEPSSTNIYGKKLIKLKYSMKYSNISNESVMNKFFSNFGHIRYRAKNIEYNNPFDIIEKDIKDDGYCYLEVTDSIDQADEIYLDFIIRGNKYIYKLK